RKAQRVDTTNARNPVRIPVDQYCIRRATRSAGKARRCWKVSEHLVCGLAAAHRTALHEKAAVNAPQSRPFAKRMAPRQSRQRLECSWTVRKTNCARLSPALHLRLTFRPVFVV